MKYRGINYDTGTKTVIGGLTREKFEPDRIAKEISIIKNELHCNAIRISGASIEKVAKASEIALQSGLEVWFSPSLPYDDQENTLNYIIEAAIIAEDLRKKFRDIVFVTGCELSLFTTGFVKGATGDDRIRNLFSPFGLIKNMLGVRHSYNIRLNKFLVAAVNEIRQRFKGKISYASGSWEKIDWKLFDIVSVDLYRASYNKSIYLKELQKYKNMGLPFCVTEFGCCTYKGAEEKGPMGWAIVDWKKEVPELKGEFVRDEQEQANYLLELMKIFDDEKIFGAFVFTFILENYKYDVDPAHDLDMASYGIVKSLGKGEGGYKDLPWAPKKAFFEIAKYNETHQR
ncbi:MAG TPA: hypothetical protein VK588_14630 [Chitinophagaceae bacterium]|nr:hypothetical protein [Chitinophagaceae bacterium]